MSGVPPNRWRVIYTDRHGRHSSVRYSSWERACAAVEIVLPREAWRFVSARVEREGPPKQGCARA